MTVTLTILAAWFAAMLAVVWAHHRLRETQRRRDREIVRRITRYLDSLPPARPW